MVDPKYQNQTLGVSNGEVKRAKIRSMGCKFSTSRHSSLGRDELNASSPKRSCSCMGSTHAGGFIKPDCLNVEKKKRKKNGTNPISQDERVVGRMHTDHGPHPPPEESTVKAVKKMMSLEDWIRSSPSPKLEPFTTKAFFKKVHPSFPMSGVADGRVGDEDYQSRSEATTGFRTLESASEDFLQALDELEMATSQGGKHWTVERDGREEENFGRRHGPSRTRPIRNTGSSGRKVRFTLPRGSDIIVFYSPREKTLMKDINEEKESIL